MFHLLNQKQRVIIEIGILLGIVGLLIILLILFGNQIEPVSFITGR